MTQVVREQYLPQQKNDRYFASLIDISELKVGGTYLFHTKEWATAEGEVIPGTTRERIYLGSTEVDGIPFIEVARSNGREHLLSVETIERCELVAAPEKLRVAGDADNGLKVGESRITNHRNTSI
jgi:hypothetical protein